MKFDMIVKERANQRAQAKIKVFKTAVIKAVQDLLGEANHTTRNFFGCVGAQYGKDHARSIIRRSLLETMLTPESDHKWPPSLWRAEEEMVSKELLETMDEMQQAVVAASTPRDEDEAVQGEDV